MNPLAIGKISPFAGQLAQSCMLVDVPKLITSYYTEKPNINIPTQRVIFGTSGHRGSSFLFSFNEWHILAITQAICLYRQKEKINGPLFIGMDTHALSVPAFASALEVLAANKIEIMISENDEYTPTPVISHAILTYNKNKTSGFADGIVITPSHNPPQYGGFKYNPPNGGPAGIEITNWIEKKANELLKNKLQEVKRIAFQKALHADTTHRHDYLNYYVNDLCHVIDMDIIKNSKIHLGVDPLGGAGVNYWPRIAEHYHLNLEVVNKEIDPTFRFIPFDKDGQIRMDPASKYAMVKLIALKNKFDIAFACDTDHDRHGIVTKKMGLLPANHYLCIAIDYLFQHRKNWATSKSIGKTVVSSEMMNRIAKKLHHEIYEVPVGFKWFVDGLLNGSLGFCGEQSAGASFSRLDGNVWTTDKDGIIAALLSAEMTAKLNCDISDVYQQIEKDLGKTFYQRNDASATPELKEKLKNISPQSITVKELAGDAIDNIITVAPGNHEPIGGVKVMSKNAWFVSRPSGTEDIFEICAESFLSEEHLQRVLNEAEQIVSKALKKDTENVK